MKRKLAGLIPAGLALALAAAPLGAFAAGPKFQSAVPSYTLSGASTLITDASFADLTGDGRQDAVLIDIANNRLAIFKGNGDGTFQDPPSYHPVGAKPREIAVADFDKDGSLDLAVSNSDTDNVSILFNRGDGTFDPQTLIPAGDYPIGVVAADLDGDGSTDLAVVDTNTDLLSVLYGDGHGTFGAPVAFPVGQYPRYVVASDFNGDGQTDLAASNDGDSNISVLLNNGNGTFTTNTYGSISSPFKLVTGDFNGDADADLAVVANGGNGAAVLIGRGDGSFETPVLYPTGNYPIDIAMGDFDGDENLDLAVTNQWGTVSFLNGNGDGTFQAKSDLALTGYIATGDWNDDGLTDLTYLNGDTFFLLTSRAEGELAFSAPTFSASENDANATVTVNRTGSDYGQTKVRIQTSDLTAVAGTDYTAVDTTIVFGPGETTKNVTVPVNNDSIPGTDRTFRVTISGPTNEATLGAQTSAVVTIQEDDPVPDTTAPVLDLTKFAVVDNYNGTPDRIAGAAGAVGESGATVRAYRWTDADSDSVVDAGELGSAIALGTSAADGSVAAADIGDLGPGTYKYVVTAEDAANNESARTAATAVTVTLSKDLPPDVVDPTWPSGAELAKANVTRTGVRLSWPAAADDRGIDHYELTQDGGSIESPSAATLSYDVGGLTAGTDYAFEVVAVDAAGNRSAPLALTVGTSPLVDPAKFAAVDNYDGTPDRIVGATDAVGRTGATMRAYRWTDADTDGVVAPGELGAAIALGTSGADGSVAAADLGDLAPGAYKFVITATGGAGAESPRSADAAVAFTLTKGLAPDVAVPTWPAGAALSVSAVTYESFKLAWPAAADDRGVDHYELTQGGAMPVILPAATLSRDIVGLTAATAYALSVVAVDADGNRSAALVVTATTLPRPEATQPTEASGEARLQLLTLSADASAVSLTPAFDMNVFAYEASTAASRIILNAEPYSPAAVLLVNGQSAVGKLPLAVDLDPGRNVIQIDVRAANGIVRAYSVTINRQEKPPAVSCFADIRGHWAEAEINEACALGLVHGGPEGLFRPDGSVTRAEWAVMVARWLKPESGGATVVPAFADAAGIPVWAREAIGAAADSGILNGYPDGTFRPSAIVSRAETAATLVRAAKWTTDPASVTAFADDASIPSWAKPYAAAASMHGIVSGKDGNRFEPFAHTTRAEAAAMLVRLSKLSRS